VSRQKYKQDPPEGEPGGARHQVKHQRKAPGSGEHGLEPPFVPSGGLAGPVEPSGGQEEMADRPQSPECQSRTSLAGIDRLVKGFTLYVSLPGHSARPGRLFEGQHILVRRIVA
jgi:hypothetical protein